VPSAYKTSKSVCFVFGKGGARHPRRAVRANIFDRKELNMSGLVWSGLVWSGLVWSGGCASRGIGACFQMGAYGA
jgi:hypothetical protein